MPSSWIFTQCCLFRDKPSNRIAVSGRAFLISPPSIWMLNFRLPLAGFAAVTSLVSYPTELTQIRPVSAMQRDVMTKAKRMIGRDLMFLSLANANAQRRRAFCDGRCSVLFGVK